MTECVSAVPPFVQLSLHLAVRVTLWPAPDVAWHVAVSNKQSRSGKCAALRDLRDTKCFPVPFAVACVLLPLGFFALWRFHRDCMEIQVSELQSQSEYSSGNLLGQQIF